MPALSQQAGTFVTAGDTLVSAMMMFVGSQDKVYIIDKVEGNAHQINGHSLYASVWDVGSRTATPIDVQTNAFCAAGMHLPNSSFVVFGGNNAVGPGGDNSAPGSTTAFDPTYQDYDGTRAIRVITPCDGDVNSSPCSWYDSQNGLQMAKRRWYPAAEALANGTVVLIGGFTSGGYINRNTPNTDPAYEGGAAEPTYEFFPPASQSPQVMNFMVKTSGLNSYALTYLMPSGKMFVQANYSTILWDYDANVETPLPDMPGQIIRVYPASGANAMLPLTPVNNYTPTLIFCGGQDMQDDQWGNYSWPFVDTWTVPASSGCHRITPEPQDGSAPTYVQDDSLPIGRTMGQFIALPDGTLLVINGGEYGTAGYAQRTLTTTTYGAMPYGESLATGPVGQPAIYNPNAPAGSRWSTAGLSSSNIPRLYHSSALLLPDGSVMVAGSNPNIDVNLTTIYPTTYTAEYFYPPYFAAKTRPVPQNIPKGLTYGGDPFDITIPSTSYSGPANDAADNTTIWLIRQGFTTHAMNMGQRIMQLNNTYTVQSDGTIILHTAQLPPNPNLFQPGPAFLFVTINGIPSNGTYVIIGNGQISGQPTNPASVLPASTRVNSANGSAPSNPSSNSNKSSGSSSHMGAIIGAVVAGIAAVGVVGAVFGICVARRRRSAALTGSYPMSGAALGGFAGREMRSSDSSAFVPLQQSNQSEATLMHTPYRDQFESRASSQFAQSSEFDPYRDAQFSRIGTPR
ncbi:copper radical oxidase variant A [Multifurca ochricompacta]|uniref:Copper radical oxidase variant A n=1 Tax=Multifurca ochricompacta TaxID=376703 RepID=A0AAD4QER7_9AGAM|nr:copper radical oxidase variant A [Multifurca ochricompacta]KAI0290926.1 copper radical oxidase variant A [Multifurca ochricompacta]